jgi:hypothetical protein
VTLDKKIKVLYVAGSGRNGSTLVSGILGQFPGFVSVGEIISIWEAGAPAGGTCGCGKPISKCEFWSGVTKAVFDRLGEKRRENAAVLCKSETRFRNLLKIFWNTRAGLFSKRLKELTIALDLLYEAVSEHGRGAIIVDASKSPVYAALLNLIPSIELYVVHLVRDPRAVARSRSRPKENLAVLSPAHSALIWLLWNAAVAHLDLFGIKHFQFVRYEDFVESPRSVINSVVDFISGDREWSPFVSGHKVALEATHSVSGNPDRFQLGEIEIAADVRWIEKMRGSDKALVTLLTLPLLRKYGYPIGW